MMMWMKWAMEGISQIQKHRKLIRRCPSMAQEGPPVWQEEVAWSGRLWEEDLVSGAAKAMEGGDGGDASPIDDAPPADGGPGGDDGADAGGDAGGGDRGNDNGGGDDGGEQSLAVHLGSRVKVSRMGPSE